ncbi:WYL domain-containing protein [Cnuibacter physcomitrellae]|uniref:helix-turn-helix transcriptional regulator n=1 Tax=Cnuibacter physcomitrellae TaxID=1619308 RepID=UPI0021758D61|nr:WYL domain-containing protein [Cnuibacter physcomitrellae]MCS5496212.1 WYL domain-containing protein [Cnuibacter physcomitrellae]
MAETTSRILALLSLLQTHRQWPGPELAARLEVTQRTLRRDVERLRELGYRVEATRGSTGGYRLEAGSQLPPLLLSDDEAVTMAIGLRAAVTQGLVDGDVTTTSALAKFEQVLPPALRSRVNALAGHVETRAPETGAVPVSQDLLGRLALACRDRERIRFRYDRPGADPTRRVVEPHALVASARTWFLVCWDVDRSDWRTFRVDRMDDLLLTRLRFEPRALPTESAAAFVERAFEGLRTRSSAEIHLHAPLAEVLARFGPWAKGAVAVDERTTRWTIQADGTPALLRILSWIPEDMPFTIVDPGLAEAARRHSRRLDEAVQGR